MKKRYYAAYGSNLNIKQMSYRCPEARVVGTTYIENYELLFKGSFTGAYLTIEPKKGSKVPITIWEISNADELALDRYEGFPNFYYKKGFTITFTNDLGKTFENINVFAYIMHEERCLGIPSPDYVSACIEGYRYFHFDEKYIYEAIKKSHQY